MMTLTQTPAAGWTCSFCLLDAVATTEAEAVMLAAIHDRLQHRGAPTAALQALAPGVRRIRRRRPRGLAA